MLINMSDVEGVKDAAESKTREQNGETLLELTQVGGKVSNVKRPYDPVL